jgi:hypothetical protein
MIKNSILKKPKTTVYLDGCDFLPAIPRSGENSQSSLIIPTNSNEVSRVSMTSASVKNVRFENEMDVHITDTLSEEYYTLNYTANKNLISKKAILQTAPQPVPNAYYKNKALPIKEYGLFGSMDFDVSTKTFTTVNKTQMFYTPTPVLSRYQRNSTRLTQALRSSNYGIFFLSLKESDFM